MAEASLLHFTNHMPSKCWRLCGRFMLTTSTGLCRKFAKRCAAISAVDDVPDNMHVFDLCQACSVSYKNSYAVRNMLV
jgi:hypothetical protein